MANLSLLVATFVVVACVSSSLAGIIQSNDQPAFYGIFGNNVLNYVHEDYHTARGAAVTDHWDSPGLAGSNLLATITSRDKDTNLVNGNLAPVRTGNGPKTAPELLMQSAVSQATGPSTMLYFDFTGSTRPVYGFGASIMLAYSSADLANGDVIIDINNGKHVQTWASLATNEIEDQWIGFQVWYPITSVRLYSNTVFAKRAGTQSVYVSVTQVVFGNTPMIINDPHFTGFQGERYEFQGVSGKWFNIISDTRFQLNALFQHLGDNKADTTNMVAFGILADDHTIQVDANSTIIVDGETLKNNVVKKLPGGIQVTVSDSDVQIDTPQYALAVMVKNTHEGKFLNLFPVVRDMTLQPHGVLGQTLHHVHAKLKVSKDHEGKGEIEGKYTDYIVSSAFATDSVFNRYNNQKDN
eukprot:TRINITY_DN194_c0_g1_i11.p1 TRINITY_DN194_c0_g1~~TRINITY_DN194_c0_g1_i11.p1  ORF type:complete len:411 (+),score=151.39 TRINITY_DN194_c0_g1_i11:55-1287(+)